MESLESTENMRVLSPSGSKTPSPSDSESEEEVKPVPSETNIVDHLHLLRENNPYRDLDERRYDIRRKIKEKFKAAPKTVLEQAEEEKPPIEKRLEDTDKTLSNLIAFGDEIITNIKVANERRELLRREFESIQRSTLQGEITNQSAETMARYNDITARWSELGELKEPMMMFNKLEDQKNRIAELMRSKDEMIAACQKEIDRINERFQEDQKKQQTDICSLVERIDGQVELLKKAYKHHLDLLQDTIETERRTIALREQSKWNEFYDTMQKNEQYKLDMAKEKKLFYASEIQRITAQQEEITRATRIRLEKDAEMLEYELRNTRNQVLMNSEKLDYNYQVLQKRNEENVIINNQQKRRVAKLTEAVSELKRKIQQTQMNGEHNTIKLTKDIEKIHDSITDLEKKRANFRISNRKKFFNVWNINYEEIKSLIEKVFDIDRILYEHQLGIPWERPDVDLEEFPLVAKEKGLVRFNQKNKSDNYIRLINPSKFESEFCSSSKMNLDHNKKNLAQKAEEERKKVEKRIEVRLLRNILHKISVHGRFLVEEKLLEFLEPYSQDQKTLVRVDNIFSALRIKDMKAANKLIDYFKPYSFCPNCMKGVPRKQLKKLYTNCTQIEQSSSEPSSNPGELTPNSSAISKVTDENIESVKSVASSKGDDDDEDDEYDPFDSTGCSNHYLIVEQAMVLTALKDFSSDNIKKDEKRRKTIFHERQSTMPKKSRDKLETCSVEVQNDTICQYWRKFLSFMPKEKEKLWHSLEHGLQHYLEVLKQREQLDKDCAFLRRQNSELKHLLQKFNI